MRETTTQDESADGLKSRDFTDAAEPWELFRGWMAEATASEPNDPTAMALATVDADGLPNVRMVLLKGADEDGFVFYTNREFEQGLRACGQPEGGARVPLEEPAPAGARPRRRDRASATPRRMPISRAARATAASAPGQASSRGRSRAASPSRRRSPSTPPSYALGEVPRPPYWTGFRICPVSIEFWHDRPFRLHDRVVFTKAEGGWTKDAALSVTGDGPAS